VLIANDRPPKQRRRAGVPPGRDGTGEVPPRALPAPRPGRVIDAEP